MGVTHPAAEPGGKFETPQDRSSSSIPQIAWGLLTADFGAVKTIQKITMAGLDPAT
jgi:hypothetical protein